MKNLQQLSRNLWAQWRRSPVVWLCLWTLPLLTMGLFAEQSLLAHDEGLYATRAKFMFTSGDWINPWSMPHYKTPGTYWLIGLFYKVFGLHEIVVRLPSLLCSFGGILLTYFTVKIVFSRTIALLSALILSLEFLWLRYSYLGNPDHVTTLCFLAAIFCLLTHNQQYKQKELKVQNDLYLFGFGFFLTLMILFRGYLAGMLMFSLLPYGVMSWRDYQYFKKPLLYVGLIVGLLPVLIWAGLSFQRYGLDTFRALFGLFVNLSQNQRKSNGFFYYFVNTSGLCFPWIIFAGYGAISLLKTRWRSQKKDIYLFLGAPVTIFILITFYKTRLSHYALSLYPFLAILAAIGINQLITVWQQRRSPQLSLKIIGGILGLVGCLLLILNGIAILPNAIKPLQLPELTLVYLALPLGCGWVYGVFNLFLQSNPKKWVASLLLGQWLSFLLLLNSGLITDVNPKLKAIIVKPEIQTILKNHTVAILGGHKTETLLKFYTPQINREVKAWEDLQKGDYVWLDTDRFTAHSPNYQIIESYRVWHLIQR